MAGCYNFSQLGWCYNFSQLEYWDFIYWEFFRYKINKMSTKPHWTAIYNFGRSITSIWRNGIVLQITSRWPESHPMTPGSSPSVDRTLYLYYSWTGYVLILILLMYNIACREEDGWYVHNLLTSVNENNYELPEYNSCFQRKILRAQLFLCFLPPSLSPSLSPSHSFLFKRSNFLVTPQKYSSVTCLLLGRKW
jgi:hypothetical protein